VCSPVLVFVVLSLISLPGFGVASLDNPLKQPSAPVTRVTQPVEPFSYAP
jgi:hypothetical protein